MKHGPVRILFCDGTVMDGIIRDWTMSQEFQHPAVMHFRLDGHAMVVYVSTDQPPPFEPLALNSGPVEGVIIE